MQALDVLESLSLEFENLTKKKEPAKDKIYKYIMEFYYYIDVNKSFIPNYGERYRHGEYISSALAESTVNELISRRMAKKQQMRWTQKGAHLLLQVRIQTLNHELKKSFQRWYPKMICNDNSLQAVSA